MESTGLGYWHGKMFVAVVGMVLSVAATGLEGQAAAMATQPSAGSVSGQAMAGSSVPAQSTAAQSTAAQSTQTQVRHRRRRHRVATGQNPGDGVSTAGSSAQATTQKQRDQQLLRQQEAQSQRAQWDQEQQVQRGAADQQKQASEPRIQDAPGPAQTGAGVSPQPSQGQPGSGQSGSGQAPDQPRIQDAPGPAQTQPAPASP